MLQMNINNCIKKPNVLSTSLLGAGDYPTTRGVWSPSPYIKWLLLLIFSVNRSIANRKIDNPKTIKNRINPIVQA